jgi:hypothetical protein
MLFNISQIKTHLGDQECWFGILKCTPQSFKFDSLIDVNFSGLVIQSKKKTLTSNKIPQLNG